MKKYPGIDYAYRPQSYWTDADPLAAILRNVTGENRRQMIKDYWSQGRLDELEPALLQDVAHSDARWVLGRIHPTFMGGEYLPDYIPNEVEIARICLRSTTSDVISLRARPDPAGIAYRILDEHDGDFDLPITESALPLTLGELAQQFEAGELKELDYGGGLALGYNNLNAESGDFERLRHFARIESEIYPELSDHFEQVFAAWVKAPRAERDAETAKEGGEA